MCNRGEQKEGKPGRVKEGTAQIKFKSPGNPGILGIEGTGPDFRQNGGEGGSEGSS